MEKTKEIVEHDKIILDRMIEAHKHDLLTG